MKLLTHISAGLFSGALVFYFFDLNFGFILLAGFAAFIPDIDHPSHLIGKPLKLLGGHRYVCHNIWFLLIITGLIFILSKNIVWTLAVFLGILSHFITDSSTKMGIHWFWPIGKHSNFAHFKGPLSTGSNIEKVIQIIFFTVTGFLFLIKTTSIKGFSAENVVIILVLLYVGYLLMNKFGKEIKKIIRDIGI
ncbi:MAG: metal-dependent hydrolase [Candidatus Undinarchaeales archaeon]